MFLKLFGLLLFSAIGLWHLREVWIDFKRGCGKFGPIGQRIWRKDDPVGFWILTAESTAFGVVCLVAGLLAFLFA